jgi:hypothetical protein
MVDALDPWMLSGRRFEVVAVEANPYLIKISEILLRTFIASG